MRRGTLTTQAMGFEQQEQPCWSVKFGQFTQFKFFKVAWLQNYRWMAPLNHCTHSSHSLLEIWRIRPRLESQGSSFWERNLSQAQGFLQMSTWRISGAALKMPIWAWYGTEILWERIHLQERRKHDDLDLGASSVREGWDSERSIPAAGLRLILEHISRSYRKRELTLRELNRSWEEGDISLCTQLHASPGHSPAPGIRGSGLNTRGDFWARSRQRTWSRGWLLGSPCIACHAWEMHTDAGQLCLTEWQWQARARVRQWPQTQPLSCWQSGVIGRVEAWLGGHRWVGTTWFFGSIRFLRRDLENNLGGRNWNSGSWVSGNGHLKSSPRLSGYLTFH